MLTAGQLIQLSPLIGSLGVSTHQPMQLDPLTKDAFKGTNTGLYGYM